MAKRPTSTRAEARDLGTATDQRSTARQPGSSTTIDIDREPSNEPMTSESAHDSLDEDDIRLRAYQRYLERGGGDGKDFDDWLEAERELKSGKS